jgi:predicted alpha-1,2-mannosidase
MKRSGLILPILIIFFSSCQSKLGTSVLFIDYVNPMIGTGGEGRISPVACVPRGMVQIGADTRTYSSGYDYDDKTILGFSHVHKSGGGCSEFQDILFLPLNGKQLQQNAPIFPSQTISSRFSHENEKVSPGHYKVKLEDFDIDVELTATARCGIQKYRYGQGASQSILIDLVHGATAGCTIVPEENIDTVKIAQIEVIDKYTIRGYRISNGYVQEQHVCFYAQFSKPIKGFDLYNGNKRIENINLSAGTNIRGVFYFDDPDDNELLIKTGISPVDMEGARKNLESEITGWDFESVCKQAKELWNDELSKISIETDDHIQREIFYTSLYYTLMYPMLLSDVDGRFRGPDNNVYNTSSPYYGGAVSIWDTFRAACPLETILCPEVMNDYVRTFLKFYEITGKLPVMLWWGGETYQMLGLHTLAIITDCYNKGIRNYDPEEAFQAMKSSAMKDTTGFSMHYFVGLKNYKKYGYVPADLEMESVARTLEYAYNDWNVAQMAKMLGKTDDYNNFLKRSASYRNVYDIQTQLMRGRFADGSWRTPFDPFASNHRRDDYCEGNAWQWTFFVPHDVRGLANLMGGKDFLIARLDTLFTLHSGISGSNTSGDISGLIGQYAHGNEPSHHTAYMYSYLGQPWKTQKYVHQILDEKYDNTPDGICGNEDTGQMSAWYVLSSIGFYPVRHGDGTYIIGSPSYKKVSIHLPGGKQLILTTNNISDTNIYIQSVTIDGKSYNKAYFQHNDLMQGGKIVFEMDSEPNPCWGTVEADLPPSMIDELKQIN